MDRTVFGTITANTSDATPDLTVNGLININEPGAGLFQPVGGIPLIDGSAVEIFGELNNHGHIHKGRKHNYVGTITPTKLTNITGSVSDMGRSEFGTNTNGELVTSDGAQDGTMVYGNPFHDSIPSDTSVLNSLTLERMIVEFKLVPRE